MARIRSFSKGSSYALSGLVHIGPLTQGSALRLHPGLNSCAASRLLNLAAAFSILGHRLFRYIRRSRKKQFGQASSTLPSYEGGSRFSHSRGEFEQPCAVPERIFELTNHALA